MTNGAGKHHVEKQPEPKPKRTVKTTSAATLKKAVRRGKTAKETTTR